MGNFNMNCRLQWDGVDEKLVCFGQDPVLEFLDHKYLAMALLERNIQYEFSIVPQGNRMARFVFEKSRHVYLYDENNTDIGYDEPLASGTTHFTWGWTFLGLWVYGSFDERDTSCTRKTTILLV